MGFKFSNISKLGKALMTPVAVLPAAGLLLRLGQADVFNIPWLAAAGDAIFGNLALIFAIGIAIGLAEENNGVAAIAAAVGYLVLTKVAPAFDVAIHNVEESSINMGVLAGIIAGCLAGYLYNRFKETRVPSFLGFFGGKRFVPILTSFVFLILGLVSGVIWPTIQTWIDALGNTFTNSGALGAGLFGFFNRLLIPFGLHHVINSLVWFQFGTFGDAQGDLWRFFAKDPTAGTFMAGFFPIMMFALPAACIAMIFAAKPQNRTAVSGMLISVALTSFLTGVTEPIEFTFLFLAPVLYGFHAVMTGISMAVSEMIGMKLGFTFSAGAIDYGIGWGISTKPVMNFVLGAVFAVIYFVVFYWAIKKFDLPTPGRLDEEESATLTNLSKAELFERSVEIVRALGGKENISSLDACITRVRIVMNDLAKIDEAQLKSLGVTSVMKMGNSIQLVVGTIADPLATNMKKAMK